MADEIKAAVESIEAKIKEFKGDISEKTQREIKAIAEDAAKEKKALTDKVNELNIKVAEKDGTIADIQQEVAELKAKTGRFRALPQKFEGLRHSIATEVSRAIGECKAAIAESASGALMKPFELKAVADISSANLSGDNYQSYLDWQPGMEPTGQFHFRNLVRTIMSETDYVQYPRANVPIGEGSFGRQTSEGATKPQVDRDYTMVNLTLYAMAAYAVVSRQALRNIVFLQSWLPTSLMNQMEESEDTDFANTLVAAASGSTSTTKTVAPEKIISYMKNLIKGKFNPNGVAVDPDVWEDFLSFRPGTDNPYSLPFVVGVTPNGQVSVLGRPIYPVNWLTGRRIIAGDWTKAAIVQSEGMRLRQSDSHASLFTSNEIAFLLERTEGLAIFRPDAFITAVV